MTRVAYLAAFGVLGLAAACFVFVLLTGWQSP